MYRNLGVFEKAMLIANQHAPFNIVSVVSIENAPAPELVHEALAALQLRHPFLHARINEHGRQPGFESVETGKFYFEIAERTGPDDWRKYALQEMNYRFNHSEGPLFRATYLYGSKNGDLILTLHHTISDASSAVNLLDELLRRCSGIETDQLELSPLPAVEDRFPQAYRGIRRAFNTGGYAAAQMGEMLGYMFRTRNKRRPQVRLGGAGRIATLILPNQLVDRLSRSGRVKGITLNSLLNAALMLAVNRRLYSNEALPMRTFSFADLRPYTDPPTSEEGMGLYISMLSYTIGVHPDEEFWSFAARLHHKIYTSLKRGEKFTSVLMSEPLLKMMTGMKTMRFGATALDYTSNVPLKQSYGDIQVAGLHGFVSAYDLGPEMASQARLFGDEVCWDFIYLDTDMDDTIANQILSDVVKILEDALKEGQ